MSPAPRRRTVGFTLIELMIVIAIIAILADILIPNFFRARADGYLSACESNNKSIGTATEMYAVDNQSHYPTAVSLLTPNYIKVFPTCPAVGTDTYSATFTSIGPVNGSNIDAYSFYCAGANHVTIDIPANFPQYNSSQGLVTGR